jgi:hypothetical protein
MWYHTPGFGRVMFFLIRYYTIFVVVLDALQIHIFSIPGVPNRSICVAVDPITRMAGGIILWAIEIIMQMRVYILFDRSKKVAMFNGLLFIASIAIFLWLMTIDAIHRNSVIKEFVQLPLPGCPTVNGGNNQWSLWLPAMFFEFVLFGFAIYRIVTSRFDRIKLNKRQSLAAVLLNENVGYFFIVACLLIFNNLMAAGLMRIPWFGYGPFHAALGITTTRMLIHLRKFAAENLENNMNSNIFVNQESLIFGASPHVQDV